VAIDFDPPNVIFEVPTDVEGTVAVWELTTGTIKRMFEGSVYIQPDEGVEYSVDAGLMRKGAESPTQESDIHWLDGAIVDNSNTDVAERTFGRFPEHYYRLVINSSTLTDNTTARVGISVGRT
jgi:hypothetical protein